MKTSFSEVRRNRLSAAAQWWAAPAAFLCTLLALPVNAGTYVPIPDQPLDTGVRVAPNILFILDNSGSMAWVNMNNQDIKKVTGPGGFNSQPDIAGNCTNGSNSYIADGIFCGTEITTESSGNTLMYMQSYVTNTLYYNPAVDYLPWVDATGNRLTGGTSFTAAYSSDHYVNYTGVDKNTSSGTINLSSNTQTFYVPKNPASTDNTYLSVVDNYNRYQIPSGKTDVIRSEYGKVVASSNTLSGYPVTGVSIAKNSWYSVNFTLPAGATSFTVTTSGGTGDADLYVRKGSAPTTGSYNCRSNGANNNETCTINSPGSSTYYAGAYAYSAVAGMTLTVTYTTTNSCDGNSVGSYGWVNCTSATPTGRGVSDELTNFATWYSYFRTRIKAAKGGAAEAFKAQGNKVRVGYRSLHPTNKSSIAPNFDIPVGDGNDGRFVNGNVANGDAAATITRSRWYNRLFAAYANNGTPLQAELKQAGDYFSSSSASGPYGPESGANQYSCRQNFTILTTDGYWNGGTASTGDVDSKSQPTITGAPKQKGDPNQTYTYSPTRPFSDGSTTWSSTLADVAMKYWVTDLRTDIDAMGTPSKPAGNNVPTSDDDPAFWQHMVTFSISIGMKTTLGLASVDDAYNKNPLNWPQPGNDLAANVDDLLHAAVNGHGKFVAATNPSLFAQGLTQALATIARRTSSSSNIATNAATIKTGGKVFNASYVSGIWTGAVNAWTLDASNNPSSLAWTASIPAFSTRKSKVFTYNGSMGTTFPTANQITKLDRSGVGPVDYPVTGAKNADYIMGDQSGEGTAVGKLRQRDTVLGDIVDSSPAYVNDTTTLYVGANDGMLHAFDAGTGVEQFAYVPNLLNFGNLAQISRGDYDHKWSVDGPVAVTSRKLTPSQNLLVGSLGRGGKGMYGLDVTSPGSFGASDVKWELSDTPNGNMGLVTGRPILTQVSTGDIAAVVGNGVNSTNDRAVLIVVNVKTGAVIREIDTGAGSSVAPNALAAPTGILGPDGVSIAYAYAGDRLGNVWKFDMTSATPSSWTATKMFTAKSADGTGAVQPITGAVTVATDPRTYKRWVFFGTGSFMTTGEAADKTASTQGMYGFVDDGSTVAYADLVKRGVNNTGAIQDGYPVRTFDAKADLPAGKKGWYLTLPGAGERIVQDAQLVSNILVTASMIPEGNGCESGGTGYINALDAFTGTSAGSSFFDLNGDGSTLDSVIGGVPVGSVNFGVGMPTLPIFLDGKLVVGGTNAGNKPGSGGISGKSWSRVSWREIRSD